MYRRVCSKLVSDQNDNNYYRATLMAKNLSYSGKIDIEEKTVSEINPNLLLKIIYKTHKNYSLFIKYKWKYLQKIIKRPASLSMVHW
jgi:hypothetical protein